MCLACKAWFLLLRFLKSMPEDLIVLSRDKL